MANRTTYDEVEKVMDTALTNDEITDLIDFANRMVTNTVGSEGLSSATLKDIETYLAAHLISIGKERQISNEKVQDIWITFTGKYGMFLQMTTFGQYVLMLDTSGNFANTGKQKAKLRATAQYPDNYSS